MGLGMEMGMRMEIVMNIRVRMGPGMELGVGMKMRRSMGPGKGLGVRMVPGIGLGLSSPGNAQHWGNHCQVMLAEGRSTTPSPEWDIHSNSGFPGPLWS